MFDGKDIIVTGGAGFIGSNMVELLLEKNRVTVVDNMSNVDDRYILRFMGHRNFKFVRGDLAFTESMDSIKHADMVIHLAANSDVRGGSISPLPDYTNNVLATFNLLEWMRKTDIPEILFSSSSAVYGEATIMPTPEDYGPYMPISTYGASKVSGEGFITAYSHYYGIRGTIFRFANIVGRNSTHGVIFDFIRKLRKDPVNLEILGDGTQRKSYLHVSDCVSSMVYVHERSRKTDIYNLGNPGTTSVRKIADTVVEKMRLHNVKYNFTGGIDGRGWKGDVKVAQLGVEKLMSTGWKNKFDSDGSVAQAIQETLDQNP
ncbi:MAG: NAD-dependent epimerase/dehydratase family protein [Thermoplasmataceae archaeon]